MAKYKVVSVIWEDHTFANRQELPDDQDEMIQPTITIGILAKKTRKTLLIISDIEKYPSRIDTSYWIILRKTILAIKEYGDIEIDNLRIAP